MNVYCTVVIHLILWFPPPSICSFKLGNVVFSSHEKASKFFVSRPEEFHLGKFESIFNKERRPRLHWHWRGQNLLYDNGDYEIIDLLPENRNLVKVAFSTPSGLLITNFEDKFFCLLQHNVIKLRSQYKKVVEYNKALSALVCASIISDAESYASSNDGWTTNRHTSYPTTDLPLDSIYGKFSSIHGLINCEILPQIASSYNLNEEYLRIGELFIAKYEFNESKQSGLGAHVDGTPWSFVIALNDPIREFTGGGAFK